MKKTNRTLNLRSAFILSFMALFLTSLISCSKDDEPVIAEEEEVIVDEDILPTITLVSGSEDLFQGVIGAPGFGSLQHTVKAEAPEGFSQLNIYKVVDGVQSGYIGFDSNSANYVEGSNTYTHNLSYIFTEIDANKEFYFIAEVIDANNNKQTLEFAKAHVKRPMQFVETIFMESRLPLEPFNLQIAQFLKVQDSEIGGVNLGTVVTNQINDKVAAVFSISEDAGYYLSSPSAVTNQDTVIEIQDKAETRFKKITSGDFEFNDFNIYDTFTVESLFQDLPFGLHEQKARQIGPGSVFTMHTDDDRTALGKITYFEIINGEVYLTIDMYITQ